MTFCYRENEGDNQTGDNPNFLGICTFLYYIQVLRIFRRKITTNFFWIFLLKFSQMRRPSLTKARRNFKYSKFFFKNYIFKNEFSKLPAISPKSYQNRPKTDENIQTYQQQTKFRQILRKRLSKNLLHLKIIIEKFSSFS